MDRWPGVVLWTGVGHIKQINFTHQPSRRTPTNKDKSTHNFCVSLLWNLGFEVQGYIYIYVYLFVNTENICFLKWKLMKLSPATASPPVPAPKATPPTTTWWKQQNTNEKATTTTTTIITIFKLTKFKPRDWGPLDSNRANFYISLPVPPRCSWIRFLPQKLQPEPRRWEFNHRCLRGCWGRWKFRFDKQGLSCCELNNFIEGKPSFFWVEKKIFRYNFLNMFWTIISP